MTSKTKPTPTLGLGVKATRDPFARIDRLNNLCCEIDDLVKAIQQLRK